MALRSCLGGEIFVEERSGTDPCVVALHGWGRDRSDFAQLDLGQRFISFDLPGFGASPEPDRGWGASEYGHKVAEAFEELNISNAIVLGHSFGGRVGICLAAHYPELVGSLVLCGVPVKAREAKGRGPNLKYRIARAANKLGIFSDKKMEALRRRYGSSDYVNATDVMRSVLVQVVSDDYTDELKTLKQPVSMFWGDQDSAAPIDLVEYTRSVVPEVGEVVVIEGGGHDVHKSHSEHLSKLLALVVESHSKAGSQDK